MVVPGLSTFLQHFPLDKASQGGAQGAGAGTGAGGDWAKGRDEATKAKTLEELLKRPELQLLWPVVRHLELAQRGAPSIQVEKRGYTHGNYPKKK